MSPWEPHMRLGVEEKKRVREAEGLIYRENR
jgi:hypothetical protein